MLDGSCLGIEPILCSSLRLNLSPKFPCTQLRLTCPLSWRGLLASFSRDIRTRQRMLELAHDPGIEAHAVLRRSTRSPGMKIWCRPKDEVARERFCRLDSGLRAEFEIHVNRLVKRTFQFVDACPLEGDGAANIGDRAMEYPSVAVIYDLSVVSLVPFHEITSASTRNLRMVARCALWISGSGCGAWNTATTP